MMKATKHVFGSIKKVKKILFVFSILLFSSSLFADDDKKEIDKLFIQLKNALNFENSKKILLSIATAKSPPKTLIKAR